MYIEKTIYCGPYMEKLRYANNQKGRRGYSKKNLNQIDEVVRLQKNNNDDYEKRNERRDIQTLKRILHTNFTPKDDFLTVTFKEKCYDPVQAKKSIRNFFDRLKRKFKRNDIKYIYVPGCHGDDGIHYHIVIEDLSLTDIKEVWLKDKLAGGIRTSSLKFDSEVGLFNLAKYLIVKNANTYYKKYPSAKCRKYSCSSSIEKPIVQKERIVQRLIKKEAKPNKGYRVIQNQIIESKFGVYQRLIQIKIE